MQPDVLVDAYYRLHKIRYPHEIDLDVIASGLQLDVYYLPRKPLKRFEIVVIDVNASSERRREQLAHEIAHHLLHAGNQLDMGDAFRTLQEEQARRYALYILAPTFMLKALWPECPQYLEQQTKWLAETFRVTYECMARRLELYEATSRRLGSQTRNHIYQ